MVTAESVVQTLEAMERYFRGGYGWGRGMLRNPINGRMCLMGAVGSVRASNGNTSWVPDDTIAAATDCMRQAVRERGFTQVENFNDTRLSYSEIAAVIARAKHIAMQTYARALPPPSRQPQIAAPRPAARPALTYQPEKQVHVVTLADMERVALKR
jgi:hypothetical protein